MISAGLLDKRIKFIAPELLTDEAGQTTTSGIDLDSAPEVFARVKQERAVEQLKNGTIRSIATYAITIRYTPEITSDWRIYYAGKFLEIQSLVEVGRFEELDIVGVSTS